MKNGIHCEAIVVKSVANGVEVAIVGSDDECAACAASSLCRKKSRTVLTVGGQIGDLKPGSRVLLRSSDRWRWRAIVVCLATPLIILTGVVLAMAECGVSDTSAAFAGIGACMGYFLILWALIRFRVFNVSNCIWHIAEVLD